MFAAYQYKFTEQTVEPKNNHRTLNPQNKCLMTGYHSLRDNWGHQYAADRRTFPLGWWQKFVLSLESRQALVRCPHFLASFRERKDTLGTGTTGRTSWSHLVWTFLGIAISDNEWIMNTMASFRLVQRKLKRNWCKFFDYFYLNLVLIFNCGNFKLGFCKKINL